ncbi:MAG: hypothetical protein AAF613_07830, partial [Pseudomonadota bacterium]
MRVLLALYWLFVVLLAASAEEESSSGASKLQCTEEEVGRRAFEYISASSDAGLFSNGRFTRDGDQINFIRYFGHNAIQICSEGSQRFWDELTRRHEAMQSSMASYLGSSMRPDGSIGTEIRTDRQVVAVSIWRNKNDVWIASASPTENRPESYLDVGKPCDPLVRELTRAEQSIAQNAISGIVHGPLHTSAPQPDIEEKGPVCFGDCGHILVALQSSSGKRYFQRNSLRAEHWGPPWGAHLSQLYALALGLTEEANA